MDPRFLAVHPATALWWQQRGKCEACVHVRRVGKTAMYCTASPAPSRVGFYPCIDARAEGARCGPDARRFELKRPTP